MKFIEMSEDGKARLMDGEYDSFTFQSKTDRCKERKYEKETQYIFR